MQIFILMLTKNPMKSLGSLAFLTFAITIFTSVTQLVDYFNGVAPKPLMNVNLILGLGLLSSQLLLTAIILKSIGNIEYYIRTKSKISVENYKLIMKSIFPDNFFKKFHLRFL